MIRKLFLLMLVGLVGGCTTLVKHPTAIKNSFVQINKSVEIKVCGNTGEKTNECKTLLDMKSTGSGAVVWNEYIPGKKPRTLVLTADHICENEEYSLIDSSSNNKTSLMDTVLIDSESDSDSSFGNEYEILDIDEIANEKKEN